MLPGVHKAGCCCCCCWGTGRAEPPRCGGSLGASTRRANAAGAVPVSAPIAARAGGSCAERCTTPHAPHLPPRQLLRKLPTAHPRGLALQQLGAAVLLERLLPAGSSSKKGRAGGRSAIDRRNAAALDPAAVVAAQPWFSDARGLVNGATSGGQAAPRGGYHIGGYGRGAPAGGRLLWLHDVYPTSAAGSWAPVLLLRGACSMPQPPPLPTTQATWSFCSRSAT